ncbi:MAG: hypothetical protein ACRCXA_01005 [Peptostreptococcaceae bacterium]
MTIKQIIRFAIHLLAIKNVIALITQKINAHQKIMARTNAIILVIATAIKEKTYVA